MQTTPRSLQDRLERKMAGIANLPVGNGRFLSFFRGRIIRPVVNLAIIGAGKAGTTSLHNWLDSHPDIFMSNPLKEPHYFSHKEVAEFLGKPADAKAARELFRRGMMLGYANERYFGESSTSYTAGAFYESNPAPRRAYDYNPDMKLVYIVRNPIARLLSHLKQDMQKGRLPRELALVPEEVLLNRVRQSCYGHQLSHWLAVFPRDQLRILVLEELSKDPRPVLNDIADFLGLANFDSKLELPKLNVDDRKHKPVGDLRLGPDQYDMVHSIVAGDLDLFETYLQREIRSRWDLSRSRWCD